MGQPDIPPVTAFPDSSEAIFAFLYQELHDLAERQLRRQGGGFTLGTTTLLHELYLDLADRKSAHFPDRARFMGYAARAMRGLVLNYVRHRGAAKRGGGFQLLSLDEERAPAAAEGGLDLEALGTALEHLGEVDPPLAELVDLHFFCGLSFVEIAELRGISDRTVQRDWQKARLFLHGALR